MEEFDRKCPLCDGTGRAKSGDAALDAMEHEVASLKWKVADLTEEFGLDLRHRTLIPGEVEAREKVGKLQVQLADKLKKLTAARLELGGEPVVCPACNGKGLVLTEAGEKLANFIYRWIHPSR
jgi:predicted methyltransferase